MNLSTIGLLVVVLFSVNAFAEGIEVLTPSGVGVTVDGGLGYVNLVTPETVSDCMKHSQIRWSLTTPGGESALGVAMTAKSLGKKLKVKLTNVCNADFPVPVYIEIVD